MLRISGWMKATKAWLMPAVAFFPGRSAVCHLDYIVNEWMRQFFVQCLLVIIDAIDECCYSSLSKCHGCQARK